MRKICLNGKWEFAFSKEPASELSPEDISWLPARVPGNVILDLQKNVIIPDPFFGLNTEKSRKYESYHFWYKRTFKVPKSFSGKRIELFLEGIDTFACIFLNGEKIGHTNNMLIPFSFDITERIDPGKENTILISLESPLNAVKDKNCSRAFASYDTLERLWARRPAHTYGWDITPRLVGAGIWKPIYLISHSPYEIKDIFIRTIEVQKEKALLWFRIEFDFPDEKHEELKVRIEGECDSSVFSKEEKVYGTTKDLTVEVEMPNLWWPYNLGRPNLYGIKVSFIKREEIIDEKSLNFGIRKIKLLQESQKDEGKSFIFQINGVKTFLLGTNWGPLDALHSRDKNRIPNVLKLVKEMNCNTVRVWGGGVYGDDMFYEICDQEGIMIWQDFAYACAVYPQKEEFLKIVKEEAIRVVKRLRNHCSLILWCGDNEVDWAYTGWYGMKINPLGNKINRIVLKEVCQLYDNSRPYWPSSPSSFSSPTKPNSSLEGDAHLWEHGTYFKDRFYSQDRSRFISEIGHLSCPNISSIRKFLPEDKIWPIDEEWWKHHFGTHKNPPFYPKRRELMEKAIECFFGEVPNNIEDYILASQVVQAEALKFWIERLRQRKWFCSGILWWNIIDCWPQFSDSIVDYYFKKKLAYDYIKKSQHPVLSCLGEPEDGKISLFLINDTLEDVKINWKIRVAWPERNLLLTGKSVLKPNQIIRSSRISADNLPKQSLLLIEYCYDSQKLCNHYLYCRPPFELSTYKKILKMIISKVS